MNDILGFGVLVVELEVALLRSMACACFLGLGLKGGCDLGFGSNVRFD